MNLDENGISVSGPIFNGIATNLQSNILKSHSRDHVRLLFLKYITGVSEISTWTRSFISREEFVISAIDQKVDSVAHVANVAANNGVRSKTVANFYLSAKGYEHLGRSFTVDVDDNGEFDDGEIEMEEFLSGNSNFLDGMKSRRANKKLKDPDVNE